MPAYRVTIPLLKGWTVQGFVEAPSPEAARLVAVQELKELYPQFSPLKFLGDRITVEEVR